MSKSTSKYKTHTPVKYTKKTARGKTYYYREESGMRTRVGKKDYEKFKGQSTKIMDKKGNILNDKLHKRLVKKYGKAEVAKALRDIANTPGEKATYKHVAAVLEPDKIRKMFINIGRDPEDVAAEFDIDVTELLDPAHWSGDTFTSSDGRSFMFHFTYDGSVFEEITADE